MITIFRGKQNRIIHLGQNNIFKMKLQGFYYKQLSKQEFLYKILLKEKYSKYYKKLEKCNISTRNWWESAKNITTKSWESTRILLHTAEKKHVF
jgi:hypothetical protein